MSRDLSDMHLLPPDTPTVQVIRGDLRLHFVTLVQTDASGQPSRPFCGLAVRTWLVVPLVYTETFEEALEALRAIVAVFLKLGFGHHIGTMSEQEKQ